METEFTRTSIGKRCDKIRVLYWLQTAKVLSGQCGAGYEGPSAASTNQHGLTL